MDYITFAMRQKSRFNQKTKNKTFTICFISSQFRLDYSQMKMDLCVIQVVLLFQALQALCVDPLLPGANVGALVLLG